MKLFGALSVVGAMLAASPALAGDFTADCDGWRDTYWFGFAERDVYTTAEATLHRLNPTSGEYEVIEVSSDSEDSLYPDQDYELVGSWNTEREGTFKATLALNFLVVFPDGSTWEQDYTNETAPFTCTAPSGPPKPPRFWKRHPGKWPVTSLRIGAGTYTRNCLRNLMATTAQGDPRIPLIRHLIAAKLNLLPNTEPGLGGLDPNTVVSETGATISDTIAAGDQILGTATIRCGDGTVTGARPRTTARAAVIGVRDVLASFNRNTLSVGESSSGLEASSSAGGCTSVQGAGLEALLLVLGALAILRKRTA